MADAGLAFTGHALVDVGIAGLCAFAKRERPEELTLEDLDRASDFLVEKYYGGQLGAYLSCVFMNASFVQPNEGDEKRREFIARYLRAHRAAEPDSRVKDARCAFSGNPATSALVRTHLPLFSGEDVLNFRPGGETWVPAAGPVVVAIFFLPLACRRAEGRMLGVLADDPELTIDFARGFLEDNRRLLALALPSERALVHEGYDREQPMWDAGKKRYKFADVKGPRSFVVDELARVTRARRPKHGVGLTAFLLSNSGQGPSLELFDLPSGAVSFVLEAASAPTHAAWQDVARRYWPLAEGDGGAEGAEASAPKKAARKKKATPMSGRAGWTRNPAFEDLCAIYEPGFLDRGAAARWLRRHVLGRIEGKSETKYAAHDSRSWKLADLFLREVLGMRQERIEAIRGFGDRLAGWIHAKNDRKLEQALFAARDLRDLRRQLLRAQRESAGAELLFGLDEDATVWLHEDGDQFLVRDLVCIRVVEKLRELGRSVVEVETGAEEAALAAQEGER